MARFNILQGPNETRLIDALRHRRNFHPVYFSIRRVGATGGFNRVDCFIDGLEFDAINGVWTLKATNAKTGEGYVARYNPDAPWGDKGLWEDHYANPPIAKLGFAVDSTELLFKAGILRLSDLLALDEFNVCSKLVEEPVMGYGMSNRLVGDAIHRFERLRRQINQMGLSFSGKRHDPSELYMMF